MQDRIAQSIDAAIVAKVAPSINAANIKLHSLSIAQPKLKDEYIQNTRQLVDNATDHIIESISRLDTGLQSILTAQREQGSSLNKKIGQVEILLRDIKSYLYILSNTQSNKDPEVPTSEIQMAVQNILASILMLISSLQLLIRELV